MTGCSKWAVWDFVGVISLWSGASEDVMWLMLEGQSFYGFPRGSMGSK